MSILDDVMNFKDNASPYSDVNYYHVRRGQSRMQVVFKTNEKHVDQLTHRSTCITFMEASHQCTAPILSICSFVRSFVHSLSLFISSFTSFFFRSQPGVMYLVHDYSGGGGTKKIYSGSLRPRGPTPYPFIYHFWQKRYPFVYLPLQMVPLSYTLHWRIVPLSPYAPAFT